MRAALVGGGLVTFGCDGVLELSHPLVISNDTSLDASGHDLTLSEGPVLQPFGLIQINPGVTLALNHLTLANGLVLGTNSTVANGAGGDAFGGAVWNSAGTLQATNCVFTNNAVLGGTGGPANQPLAFNYTVSVGRLLFRIPASSVSGLEAATGFAMPWRAPSITWRARFGSAVAPLPRTG